MPHAMMVRAVPLRLLRSRARSIAAKSIIGCDLIGAQHVTHLEMGCQMGAPQIGLQSADGGGLGP